MIEIADAEQEIKTQTTELNEVQEEIEQECNHKASTIAEGEASS